VAAVPPDELFTVAAHLPDLRGVPLVEMLDGFIDAGMARRLTRDHLFSTCETAPVATFDVDLLHDYRARRPPMVFDADHWESYEAPTLEVRLLRDGAGAPFLVLAGSEPDVMWERFVAAVGLLVDRLGVGLVIGTNAIPMAVPHTRPIGITAHAARKELIEGYQPWVSRVQVPGSAAHLLEHRLALAGHDSLGFAVHVPHYLAQAAFPPAAEALLRALTRATGLVLEVDGLEELSRQTQESIAGLVAQSEELTELVRTLETQYDAVVADRGTTLSEAGSLPTADELGAELERFLAERSRKRDD
jgi:hypothetical protein